MFACHNFDQFLHLIDRLTINFCTEIVTWGFMAPHVPVIWCRCFSMAMVVVRVVIASRGAMAKKSDGANLDSSFYQDKCPGVQLMVQRGVEAAMQRDPRMPASLLRLHFHDCFVNGCDGSVLLDDRPGFVGEKTAGPNLNSARGFEVIDEIKQEVEIMCPETVSCADILAMAARDSVFLSGGPFWDVELGRRDSLTASKSAANNAIPKPTFNVPQLTASFKAVGLNEQDVVALSGSHTIGKARCTSFQARLFNQRHPDELPTSGPPIEVTYLGELRRLCPQVNGDGNVTNPLDACTPTGFDNQYFKDLQASQGLLFSDAALQFTPGLSLQLVELYANDQQKFFDDFTHSMLKMGAIHVLTSDTGEGEVRRNCRIPNSHFSLQTDPQIGL